MNDLARTLVHLAVLAILLVGIGRFSRPASAPFGNLLIAVAMVFALAFEVVNHPLHAPVLVLAAFAVGSLAGVWTARRIN
ncbi:MAG: hypothetical protein ACYC6Y_19140, partial [Thermoguttaceae bacterium]